MLSPVRLLAATYDYRTRRLETTEKPDPGTLETTAFRYDGGVSFQEIGLGAIKVEFVHGSGMGGGVGSVLYFDRASGGGIVEHFAYNAVGHTTALTNAAGSAVKHDLYNSFGGTQLTRGSSRTTAWPTPRSGISPSAWTPEARRSVAEVRKPTVEVRRSAVEVR